MKVSISGIRGIFGEDLSLQEISRFSRIFGSYVKDNFDQYSCVIGRDSRPSGKIICDIVTASLLEQGIDVYDLGIIPTPVLFRESRKYSSSIMITASHNPLEWNGLKMLIRGRGLFEEELDQVLHTKIHDFNKIGKYVEMQSSSYLDDLMNYIPIFTPADPNFRVGFDFGGGSSCNYVNHMYDSYGLKYLSINDKYGFSSRGPDPTSDPLTELCELVKINKLNFGFAFDNDSDRLVVVNNRGEHLSPDLTLLLCVSSVIHNNGFKKFAISLDSSYSIEKYIKDHAGQVFYSKVGEANVIKKINETECNAGGEGSSGGFIMPDFTSCRDGLLSSITISSLSQKIIDEVMDLSSNFKQIRTKFPIKPEVKTDSLFEKILAVIKPHSTDILYVDGLKFIMDHDSWVLIRSSNTEHVLRISLESNKNKADSLNKMINNKITEIYEKI